MNRVEMTPKEIVKELDRYVIGQDEAKKQVAIAIRNRWRRIKVSDGIKHDIMPNNILMIGPTGVGKTEIARRLSKLVDAPFIKVEATKFTEVGYVGRDVDSIVRDLLENAIELIRKIMRAGVRGKAERNACIRIIEALVGKDASTETKEKFLEKLKNGDLDNKEIEIDIQERQRTNPLGALDMPGMGGGQVGILNLGQMLNKAMGKSSLKRVKLKVSDAYKMLLEDESDKLLDEDEVIDKALRYTENNGIIFLDEIDKIVARNTLRGEVSREGVQRDLLPLVEGTTVSTKYGSLKTDHILFIASGAFHVSKPSDLLPELQGRFPIKVELNPLSEDDLRRILSEPKYSLTKQYKALLDVENVEVIFKDKGILEIARLANKMNKEVENIGARRLHTIMEKLLEGLNFTADELSGSKVEIDEKYVVERLGGIMSKMDLSKFIL